MTINLTYHGIESTPAISAYVDEKMQGLTKYFEAIEHIDVEVGKTSEHHQKGDIFSCKAAVQTQREVIRIEREAEELYKAIDKVRDHLRMELSSLKERIQERHHGEGV